MRMNKEEYIKQVVKEKYGEIAMQQSQKNDGCCGPGHL